MPVSSSSAADRGMQARAAHRPPLSLLRAAHHVAEAGIMIVMVVRAHATHIICNFSCARSRRVR